MHFFVKFDGEDKIRSLERIVDLVIAIFIIAMVIFSIVNLPEAMDKEDKFHSELIAPYVQAIKAANVSHR